MEFKRFLSILLFTIYIVEVYSKSAKNSHFERIIGGIQAKEGQFPHQIYIKYSAYGSVECGGSLISKQHVLTAAHCLTGQKEVHIKTGVIRSSDYSGFIIVKNDSFTIHPDYNLFLHNDIAIVTLPSEIEVTNKTKPIRLPKKSDFNNNYENKNVTVSGWGYSESGYISTNLNYVDLNVISNVKCKEVYGSLIVIDSTLCCEGNGNTTRNACTGDNGGPLMVNESDGEMTLIGVTSFFSDRGCKSEFPSGYVRTGYYLDWIKQVTGIPIRS